MWSFGTTTVFIQRFFFFFGARARKLPRRQFTAPPQTVRRVQSCAQRPRVRAFHLAPAAPGRRRDTALCRVLATRLSFPYHVHNFTKPLATREIVNPPFYLYMRAHVRPLTTFLIVYAVYVQYKTQYVVHRSSSERS